MPIDPLNESMDLSQANSTSRSRSRRSAGAKSAGKTNTSKNTSSYDRAFQQNLIDEGVFPYGYEFPDGSVQPKPGNWEEINRRLAKPRPSLSPSKFSDEQFEKFVRADTNAAKEHQVQTKVIPILEGESRDPRTSSGKIPFTNLAQLTEHNLVPGDPDVYHGARPEALKRKICDELSDFIVPSTQLDLPIIPNHVTAAKGPDGTFAVAGRQAYYDGAIGARSINALQSFGQQEPKYDGNAYTFSNIY